MMLVFKKNLGIWLPILLLALIAPLTPYLDLKIASYFYQGNGQFVSNDFTYIIFKYGFLPADFFAGISLLLFLGSFFVKKWKRWRAASLVMVMTAVVGSVLIVHALLKDHWGRPRPKQVVEFGGTQAFRPFYSPYFSNPIPSKSFSCGHCSAGFYFFALILIGRKERHFFLYFLGIALTLLLGGSLTLVRVMQGGHFFSDALASALVMWLTAYFSVKYIYDLKNLKET